MKSKYDLPEYCYAETPSEPGKIIIIKNGESGYYLTDYIGDYMEYNKVIGVSKYQAKAMVGGSMFGWNTEMSNPKTWERTWEQKNKNNKEEL